MKALQDIVVLDLTRVLAGPYCTMMLADFGADVIKIEIPVKGDDTRGMGPFVNNSSLYYANVNRNKKSVTLNLKDPKGKELFLAMVKKADVVVENYRPGVMDKLGVGYDVLKEVNDRIIYAAVSGFGSYGRNSARPGYDIIAQAYGGLMSITGEPDGEPLRVGTAIGDVLGGMNLTIGVLMALHARELSGKGQRVDVALVDSVISSLETGTQRYFASGKLPRRIGNRYASAYPYDSFKAKDDYFVIASGTDKHFEKLSAAMGMPELAQDPLYCDTESRKKNADSLKEIIEKWTADKTVSEVCKIIDEAGIPVAPIYNCEQAANDKNIVEVREMLVKVPAPVKHPDAPKELTVIGNPLKMEEAPCVYYKAAPDLGENNEEIFESLGFTKEQLEAFRAEGVIN